MKVFMFLQGSPEWHQARRGVPTASSFDKIITAKTAKLSAQADDYIAELIGARLSLYGPENAEHYTNSAIRWGQQTEAEARAWYSMQVDQDVQQVGFCLTDDDRFGCSPDGLVGEDGLLELKCPQPGTQAKYLLKKDELLMAYRPQVHGQLVVTGRKWVDLASYSPGLPPLVLRVEPDDYTAKLREALEGFWTKFQAALCEITGEVPSNPF